MPAHNEEFPWMCYNGNYMFFEKIIRNHNKINNIQKTGESSYKMSFHDGRQIKVFICDCYSFGMAEYYEVVERLGEFDAIIISSLWCGYTTDVKRHCRDCGVGLFKIGEFMAALRIRNFWMYLTQEQKDSFE